MVDKSSKMKYGLKIFSLKLPIAKTKTSTYENMTNMFMKIDTRE